MLKKGHSEEQIFHILRQAESGTKVVRFAASTASATPPFYIWKKLRLGLSELRELR
jgi:hypothetical protein